MYHDITKLPPELLIKGRFDEIFYVGLPNESERKKSFEIHIEKRRKADINNIYVSKVVRETKGCSGADIEVVVKGSIEIAFADGKKSLTTGEILMAIKNTHYLSEIMKKPLEKMSKKYGNRKFKKLYSKCMKSYKAKKMGISDKEWLKSLLKESLPEMTEDELKESSSEIVKSINDFNLNLSSINDDAERGVSKKNWFADKIQESAVGMSVDEYGRTLIRIDDFI